MRKLLTCLITAIFLFAIPAFAKADTPVKVAVDGQIISFPDQQPYINSDNRTMVPVRAPMEAMGCDVEWDNDTRQATITKGDITAVFTIGSKTYTVNGENMTMDTQAVITGGRTAFPIRFAAEAMGAEVKWSDASRIAYIFIEKKNDEQAIIKDLDQKNKITVPVVATPKAPGTISIDVSKLEKMRFLEDEPKWFQAIPEQIAELQKLPTSCSTRAFDGYWAYNKNKDECPAYEWVGGYFCKIPYTFVSSQDLIYGDDYPFFRGYMDFQGKGFIAVDLEILNGHIIIFDPVTNTNMYDEFVQLTK